MPKTLLFGWTFDIIIGLSVKKVQLKAIKSIFFQKNKEKKVQIKDVQQAFTKKRYYCGKVKHFGFFEIFFKRKN